MRRVEKGAGVVGEEPPVEKVGRTFPIIVKITDVSF